MKKRLLALALALAMIVAVAPMALAEGETEYYSFDSFVAAVTETDSAFDGASIEGNYQKDAAGRLIIQWSPVSGCRITSGTGGTHGSYCTEEDGARKEATASTPARVNSELAQYQLFSGIGDLTIKNVSFQYVAGPFWICVNSGWAVEIKEEDVAAKAHSAQLHLYNTGTTTVENCVFDNVVLSPWNSGTKGDTTITSCTFQNIYDSYAVKDVQSANTTITGCTFTNVGGGIMLSASASTQMGTITIENNSFTNVDVAGQAAEGKAGTRGLVQIASSGDYSKATLEIKDNTVANSGPVLRQLNNTVETVTYTGNNVELTYTNGDENPAPQFEAAIEGKQYTTLEDAIGAAKDNDTVEILTNCTIESAISITRNITIDGNENTVTAENAAFYIQADLNSLNIHDLTMKGAPLAEGATANEGATGPWMGIGTYNGNKGVEKLTLTNVTIDGFSYGLYFGMNPDGSGTNYNDKKVSIDADDLTIQNCYIKGAYIEKLTDSTFTNCVIQNNGTDPDKVQSENNKKWMCGIDLNLKGGNYENIKFENCSFANNGANNGTALHIKARDDGNYAGDKAATLTGVTVTGCTFESNNDKDMNGQTIGPIVLGEPDKNNKTPVNVSIQPDVAFTNNLADTGENAAFVVTFDSNGGSAVATQIVSGQFTLPAAPSYPGYAFLGWYDEAGTRYDANVTVTISADTTFTAQWAYVPPVVTDPSYAITTPVAANGTVTVSPTVAKQGDVVTITATPNEGYELGSLTVTDRLGNAVAVQANPNGTYSFVMPNSQVTITASFTEEAGETWVNPFIDVASDDWFYPYVEFVCTNGLMNGTSAVTFEPGATTTRGMVMTILARLDGVDTSASAPWYQMGMEWAVAEGVSDGTAPEGTITREQIAAMLYRYAGSPAVSGDALAGFPDADSVNTWAVDAMNWAVSNGVITGGDKGLDPQGQATRAELATMLARYCENIVK